MKTNFACKHRVLDTWDGSVISYNATDSILYMLNVIIKLFLGFKNNCCGSILPLVKSGVLNFLCFMLIIIHYHTLEQRKIPNSTKGKIEPQHNHTGCLGIRGGFYQGHFFLCKQTQNTLLFNVHCLLPS